LLRWPYSNEGANEGDANAIDIIALGMSTLGIPTATFIDESISTNEKIIANMIPTPAIHVKALHNADSSLTDILEPKGNIKELLKNYYQNLNKGDYLPVIHSLRQRYAR